MEYFVDEEQKYLDELLFHLRAHNYSHTNDKRKIEKYIYIFENETLIGYAQTNVGWGWASIGDFFYKSIDILRALVEQAVSLFHDQVFGFKTSTRDAMLMTDLKQVGFEQVGSSPQLKGYVDRVYFDLIDYNLSMNNKYRVNVLDEKDAQYEGFLSVYLSRYEKHNGEEQLDSILYVCMDDDEFCGGVQFEVYKNWIHTHLLAVKKEYTTMGIGSVLMQYVEEYARKQGIQLLTVGTTEFQARPFYEKLGYKVVFTRQNNPEGYESYTLIKEMKE